MSEEFNEKYEEAYHIIGCLVTLMTLPTQMPDLSVPSYGRWYTYKAIPQLIRRLKVLLPNEQLYDYRDAFLDAMTTVHRKHRGW
jgi:hypothetical protein